MTDIVRQISRNRAELFLKEYHYLGSLGASATVLGWLRGNEVVGVACFGSSSSQGVSESVFGPEKRANVRELVRFALKEGLPHNSASWFLARALKLYAIGREDILAIVSFADEDKGHIGKIYQATNAVYVGGSKSVVVVLPGGKRMSGRYALEELANGVVDPSKCQFFNSVKHKYVYFLSQLLPVKNGELATTLARRSSMKNALSSSRVAFGRLTGCLPAKVLPRLAMLREALRSA